MAQPTLSSASTTVKSLNSLHTALPPSAAPQYLTHFVVQSLLRRGFDGAEAGALTEIERLLEHHILNVFTSSHSYAHLSGRSKPNAFDLLAAREQEGMSSVKKLKRESKRRRRGIPLETIHSPPSPPPQPHIEDLPDLASLQSRLGPMQDDEREGEDRKPDLSLLDPPSTAAEARKVVRLDNAFEGAPGLPPKWTYPAIDTEIDKTDSAPPIMSTKTSLDFVKLTASQSGGLPPELGIVNYRTQGRRGRSRAGGMGKG